MATKFGFQIESSLTTNHLTDGIFIKGSYAVVKTVEERDALPVDAGGEDDDGVIVKGSLVYVQDEDLMYLYDGSAYIEFAGGELGNAIIDVETLPTENIKDSVIYRTSEDDITKLYHHFEEEWFELGGDSYLTRAKANNPDANFDDVKSLIIGMNNKNVGSSVVETMVIGFNPQGSIPGAPQPVSGDDSQAGRDKVKKYIEENFAAIAAWKNLEPAEYGTDGGWWVFANSTDMVYVPASRAPGTMLVTFKKINLINAENVNLIGVGLTSSTPGTTVLGKYNESQSGALIIGNGTDDEHRSDALVIDQDGTIHAESYYIKDKLFNADYAETDESKPTFIKNKLRFADGLIGANGKVEYKIEHTLDNPDKPLESGNFTITLPFTSDDYVKIETEQLGSSGGDPTYKKIGIIDLLTCAENTTLYQYKENTYAPSMDLVFKSYDKDTNTIIIRHSDTYTGIPWSITSFHNVLDFRPVASFVKVNYDDETITLNDEGQLTAISSDSIIDVEELPTGDFNKNVLYKLTEKQQLPTDKKTAKVVVRYYSPDESIDKYDHITLDNMKAFDGMYSLDEWIDVEDQTIIRRVSILENEVFAMLIEGAVYVDSQDARDPYVAYADKNNFEYIGTFVQNIAYSIDASYDSQWYDSAEEVPDELDVNYPPGVQLALGISDAASEEITITKLYYNNGIDWIQLDKEVEDVKVIIDVEDLPYDDINKQAIYRTYDEEGEEYTLYHYTENRGWQQLVDLSAIKEAIGSDPDYETLLYSVADNIKDNAKDAYYKRRTTGHEFLLDRENTEFQITDEMEEVYIGIFEKSRHRVVVNSRDEIELVDYDYESTTVEGEDGIFKITQYDYDVWLVYDYDKNQLRFTNPDKVSDASAWITLSYVLYDDKNITIKQELDKLENAIISGGGTVEEDITVQLGSDHVGNFNTGYTIAAGTSLTELLKAMLQKRIPPTYSSPSLKITASPSTIEKDVDTEVTFTLTFTKGDAGDLTSIGLNGETAGTTSPHTTKLTLNASTTKSGTASYNEGAIKKDNMGDDYPEGHIEAGDVTGSASVTAIYPYYYGVSDTNTVTVALVTGGTKDLSAKGSKTYKFTAKNQYLWIAFDSSYGTITHAIDENNFENIGDFEKKTVTVGNATYTVYITSGAAAKKTCTDFAYTFK